MRVIFSFSEHLVAFLQPWQAPCVAAQLALQVEISIHHKEAAMRL
jgi:hypothetical protein